MNGQGCCDLLPVRLRCEYLEDPVAIHEPRPRITWALECPRRLAAQTAFQVRVASSPQALEDGRADRWDSGRVESDCPAAFYDGPPLPSRAVCCWQVRVWDEAGEPSPWSNIARWEMGLLDRGQWRAAWIALAPERRGRAAPIFRRAFSLPAPVRRARLYACGLGWHEARINGQVVGDAVLEPAQTDYNRRCFYVVRDATALLREGENALALTVGDGWFCQDRVWADRNQGVPLVYGEPRLLAQLEIDCLDGSRHTLATDHTWRAAPGPVLDSNVYAGETYDARAETEGWDGPGFDDSKWDRAGLAPDPGGELLAQPMPPMRRCRQLPVRAMHTAPDGATVLDFGENFAGWVRLRLRDMAPGAAVEMRFAEALAPDGAIDPASTGVFATFTVQTDRYVCRGGGEETWEPRFTYHGFRYAEVRGVESPQPDQFTGIEARSDLARTGRFQCADAMLERLHDMAVRTHLANAHGIPEDCPARERCGWLADAAIVCEYSLLNLDATAFWRKYAEDIETTRDGDMPYDIAPGLRRCGRGVPDWVRAAIFIPWTLYVHTGDERFLSRHYDMMRLVIESLGRRAQAWILSGGRGDWCDPGASTRPTYTPEALTTTAWFALDADIMARAATRLSRHDDAARYAGWREEIARAFVERFYDPQKRSFGSQTADAMALALGLAPEARRRDIAEALARDVRKTHDLHFTTGIFGMRYIGEALNQTGHGDLALALFNQTTPPSFGDLIARGATTLWEYWGEPEVDRADGPRSMSHPMFGGFDTWLYQGVAGIRPDPDAPGWQRAILEPIAPGDMTWARARVQTDRGPISSAWRRGPSGSSWEIALPPGCAARARIPAPRRADVRESGGALDDAQGVTVVERRNDCVVAELSAGAYRFEW